MNTYPLFAYTAMVAGALIACWGVLQGVQDWRVLRRQQGMPLFEPWHLIALGFGGVTIFGLVGMGGLIWHFRSAPAKATEAMSEAHKPPRPDTRLRIRLDPAGTHYYLEVSQTNIDSWRQTLVQYSSQDASGSTKVLHHVDTLALTFTVPIVHERPIIETFGHKLGGYNYHPLSDRGAIFQFFESVQAPVVEIWFPPPGHYEAQSKKAIP